MPRKPVSPKSVLTLIAMVLVLPIAITVVLALAALLTAMQDAAGGLVLGYVALACGIVWVISLLCLVLAQGINSLGDDSPGEEAPAGRGPREPEETDR